MAKKPPYEEPAIGEKPPFGEGDTAEVARQIGRVVSGYSVIEWHAFILFAMLSSKSGEQCYIEFFAVYSIKRRLNMIRRLVKRHMSPEFLKPFDRLSAHTMTAASRRADFAHIRLFTPEAGFVEMKVVNNRVVFQKWKNNSVLEVINQFRRTIRELQVFQDYVHIRRWWRLGLVLRTLPVLKEHIPDQAPGVLRDRLPQRELDALVAAVKRLGLPFLEKGQAPPQKFYVGYSYGPAPHCIPWETP